MFCIIKCRYEKKCAKKHTESEIVVNYYYNLKNYSADTHKKELSCIRHMFINWATKFDLGQKDFDVVEKLK